MYECLDDRGELLMIIVFSDKWSDDVIHIDFKLLPNKGGLC